MKLFLSVACLSAYSAAFAPHQLATKQARAGAGTYIRGERGLTSLSDKTEETLDGSSYLKTDGFDAGKQLFPSNSNQNANLVDDVFSGLCNTTTVEAVQAVLDVSSKAAKEAEAALPLSTELLDITETPEIIIPASESIDNSSLVTSKKIEPPSVVKIIKFAIPACGVWLCGPLLSLIDTSAVGMLSGVSQQAALNPAVAVTEYTALLIAFMYTGSTNLIAAAHETDQTVPGSPRTSKSFIGALQLSTYVGGSLGVILFCLARPLLKAIIGNDSISPMVFDAAMKYVRIRALGMPAAAMIGSAQAACLGMQDIRSPLYVLLAAAVVNFMGDMIFVGSSHPLIGGAAGAAWATVFSQYAAVSFFIHWLLKKPKSEGIEKEKLESKETIDLSKAILEMTSEPSAAGEKRRKRFRDTLQSFRTSRAAKAESKEKRFSVHGFLQGKTRKRDLIKFPSRHTIEEFSPYVVPVTSTQFGRISGYVAMSHVISSALGTFSMAAQQVIVSLFYCLTPLADSLSLTAQSFLPAISEKEASKERAAALKTTIVNFFKAGGVFGALMVAAVSSVPLYSSWFTSDPKVADLVNMVVPQLIGFFSVHGVLCASEGLLLGQKDLGFLGKMYTAFFFAVPFFMLRLKRAALSGAAQIGLTSVWTVFLGYQLIRFAIWVGRVGVLQRRANRQAEKLP